MDSFYTKKVQNKSIFTCFFCVFTRKILFFASKTPLFIMITLSYARNILLRNRIKHLYKKCHLFFNFLNIFVQKKCKN